MAKQANRSPGNRPILPLIRVLTGVDWNKNSGAARSTCVGDCALGPLGGHDDARLQLRFQHAAGFAGAQLGQANELGAVELAAIGVHLTNHRLRRYQDLRQVELRRLRGRVGRLKAAESTNLHAPGPLQGRCRLKPRRRLGRPDLSDGGLSDWDLSD